MKKAVLVVLSVLVCTGLPAQVGNSFSTNLFLSGQAGIGNYSNQAGGAWGMTGGVELGKWIAEPVALRLGLDVLNVPCMAQSENINHGISGALESREATMFINAGIQTLWDPLPLIGRAPQDWYVRFYPLLGIGASVGDTGTLLTEFNMVFGMHIPFSFNRYSGVAGFIEGKYYLLPDRFDRGHDGASMSSITVGLTKRFNQDPYHRRTARESREANDDWFVGFGIGANYSAFDIITNPNRGGLSMIGLAPELMVGRNISNFWTLRLELTGLTAHQMYDTITQQPGDGYSFTYLHADIMVNLTHAVYYRRGVKWNILPYLGTGPVWRYDEDKMDMAGNIGLMFRRYVSARSDFYIDAKYIMVPPAIGGSRGPSDSVYGIGLPTLTAGYIYNFGTSSTRYRLPASFSNECAY